MFIEQKITNIYWFIIESIFISGFLRSVSRQNENDYSIFVRDSFFLDILRNYRTEIKEEGQVQVVRG